MQGILICLMIVIILSFVQLVTNRRSEKDYLKFIESARKLRPPHD